MLRDKVVLVIGAAGRIGSSFVTEIVQCGGKVVLADVNKDATELLVSRLGPERTHAVKADVTEPQSLDRLIQSGLDRFGRLDAAVHSAYPKSVGWGDSFEELDPDNLAQDLYCQLGGAILFSQKMILHFRRQGHGNLIHVASIQGVSAPKFNHYRTTGMVSPIEYTAIKAGIIAVTRYLAKYCSGQNIRVNCISPGGILDDQPSRFVEEYRRSCNSKGLLDSQDLAGTVMFLLSDNSAYITGQNLIIDDGWSL